MKTGHPVRHFLMTASFCASFFSSCISLSSRIVAQPFLGFSREQLINASYNGRESQEIFSLYRNYYKILVPPGTDTYWDRTGPEGHTAVFVYSPPNPLKTILCLHGYITHSGTQTFLIQQLLSLGYRVVCADLPGHGLSLGTMCDIDDFSTYGIYMQELVSYCNDRWQGGLDFIAHSTGCAVAIEYLRQGGTNIDRMVFISPLVRSFLWNLALAGMGVTEFFSTRFPTIRPDSTRDKEFNQIIDKDPLRNTTFPYHWVKELDEWNQALIKDTIKFHIPILILQGSDDTVVDGKYAKKYFDKTFTVLDYAVIKGGIHNMHCDKLSIRTQVFARVAEFLVIAGP